MTAVRGGVSPVPIAPVWHTCCLLAVVAAFGGFFVYARAASGAPGVGHIELYTVGIAFEWATFAICLWHTDVAFAGYVARSWKNPRTLLWDIPVAAILVGVLLTVAPVVVRVLGSAGFASTQGMLPANRVEVALWIVLAISAGICEETVFRGYLQQQLSGWTGSVAIGALGQGVIFGMVHAYQGPKKVALIAVWGCVFGLFVWLRKGLRANMIGHAVIDLLPVL
jgi:membrane protease YdiL (CAAX protease family)